jgi:hypothetical protein
MFLGEVAVQRMDVINILLECLTGYIKKGVTICLDGLTLAPSTKSDMVTFTAYTRPLIALIPV